MQSSFIIAALTLCLMALTLLLLGQRREHRRMLDGLPTGLCAIGENQRIRSWNRQMSRVSGIDARTALASTVDALPAPWPEAFGGALAPAEGAVIRQALPDPDGGATRWVILHGSAARTPTGPRFVLVEEITDYQRLQDELLHNERLASIGRLAAGVAHEIGNPVTGIACVAQNLEHSADSAELEQSAAEILKQTDRITRTVSSLMQLSHPGSAASAPECVACNLADCVDEAIHLLTLDREVAPGSFVNNSDRELLVSADNQLLLQVVLNVLDNARAAAQGRGPISIDARQQGDMVHLYVDNPGEVVEPDILAQAFEPFFTTKDVGEGTGLGLPLVRRMLQDMGGTIRLISPVPGNPAAGTRAHLTLARAEYTDL